MNLNSLNYILNYILRIAKTNLKNIPLNKAEYKNILLIAEENRKIIGFIWGNFISFGVSPYGYIDDLFVDENYRNQRVASKLIALIKEQFKALSVNAVFTQTGEDNHIARNLYQKEGFNPCQGLWFYWTPKV